MFSLTLSILGLIVVGLCQGQVEVKTEDGRGCSKSPWIYNGYEYTSCSVVRGKTDRVAKCPTDTTSGVAMELFTCDIMTGCTSTVTGKTCVKFSYKGKEYPAGTCVYAGGDQTRPWCATKEGITSDNEFTSSSGHSSSNWDYCSCSVVTSEAVVAKTATGTCLNTPWTYRGVTYDQACQMINGVASCATSATDGVASEVQRCTQLEKCLSTRSGKSCKKFTYKDTTYEAGVCSYVDAGGRFPWCATEDDVTSFTDETGKKNWDFCTCEPRAASP